MSYKRFVIKRDKLPRGSVVPGNEYLSAEEQIQRTLKLANDVHEGRWIPVYRIRRPGLDKIEKERKKRT